MRSSTTWLPLCLVLALLFVSPVFGQVPVTPRPLGPMGGYGGATPVAVEFMSPVLTEFVPNQPGDFWEIIIEGSINQGFVFPRIGVFESFNMIPPGLMGPLPTDVNGDMILGDVNPFFPDLVVTLNEPFLVMGTTLPVGTNIASLFHKAGSEMELDGTQTTTYAMTVDPGFQLVIDSNGDGLATLYTKLRAAVDKVQFNLGVPTANLGPQELANTPTISFFTPDWVSTVNDMGPTSWVLGIEVRIHAIMQGNVAFAVDPIPGPWLPPLGVMPQIQTGFSVVPATPGAPNPNFPTLEVVFSDDFMDFPSGQIFPGGIISGCINGNPALLRVTGSNLATLIQEVGVTYWYGPNGVPDNPGGPEVLKDDQIIYRFVMLVDGMIMDTDVLPQEMMVTAGIVTYQGLSSITNMRLKHDGQFMTPDP